MHRKQECSQHGLARIAYETLNMTTAQNSAEWQMGYDRYSWVVGMGIEAAWMSSPSSTKSGRRGYGKVSCTDGTWVPE